MKLFDTHAYLGLLYEDKIERLVAIKEAKMAGVQKILNIANRPDEFKQVYDSLKSSSDIYYAVGLSPVEMGNSVSHWREDLHKYVKLERVVAVGETGLDRRQGDKAKQVESFIFHLDLAQASKLPVILHNRESGEELLSILQNQLPSKGGILHCFSENWGFAKKALDLNLYFSFAGNLTYSGSSELQKVAKNLPLDRILIESESPFMIPHAMRAKKRNQPAYLKSIFEFLCTLRTESPEEIEKVLYENSLNIFSLDKN